MTANRLPRGKNEGAFCQISNKGIKEKNIFEDEEDFSVFTNFLNEYLSPPSSVTKKTFVVDGHSYQGVPHLPKNHSGQIELIAYSLTPDSFNLLLKQINEGSLEKFMRSLSTRYSMYFNKKYNRKGPVFAGPYKSKYLKDHQELLNLTRSLHQNGHHSSLEDYLGTKNNPWVKSDTVLNYFNKVGSGKYSDFIKNKIADETNASITYIKSSPGFREFFTIITVFVVLATIGIRHVIASEQPGPANSAVLSVETVLAPSPPPPPAQEVLSPTQGVLSPTQGVSSPAQGVLSDSDITLNIAVITVQISDGSKFVNIRSEASVKSQKIGEAINGEVFELISSSSKWYEVKLADGSTGYISASYIETP